MNKSLKQALKDLLSLGVIKQNPVFVLALSLTPILAVSTSVDNAWTFGLIVLVSVTLTHLIVSFFKNTLNDGFTALLTLTVLAALVSIADMMLLVANTDMHEAFGLYLPLTAVSALIIVRATYDKEASKGKSIGQGFSYGLGYLFALLVITIIRVVLDNGAVKLLGIPMRLFDTVYGFTLANTPFGALLIVGLFLGLYATLKNRGDSK